MLRQIMEQAFSLVLLPVPILESAKISHAALRMMTVYELERPIGTSKTHKRCGSNLDDAIGQFSALVRRSWGVAAPARDEDVVNALFAVLHPFVHYMRPDHSGTCGSKGRLMAKKQSDCLFDLLAD